MPSSSPSSASEKKLRSVIVKELEEVKKQYGDDRRTVIEDEAAEIHLEDLIADEQIAVTVSHSGYLKRTPISTYRKQRRGGTGRTGMKTRDEDFVEHLFIASTHAYILIFTNTGRVYWLKVYEIPDVGAAGKGKHIGNLVALQAGETVRTMLAVRDLEEAGKYIFFATRNGTVKKTELKDFSHVMSRGIIAINIEKGDELVAARSPMASRSSSSPRMTARPSASKKAMSVPWVECHRRARHEPRRKRLHRRHGDHAQARSRHETGATAEKAAEAERSHGERRRPVPKKGSLILSVTENGYGKRTPADEYRLQNRGG